MKTSLILILMIGLFACTNDDSPKNSQNDDQTKLQNTISTGSWKISSYLDDGKDETADFNGMTFSFNSGGVVKVNSSGTEYTGSWSTEDLNDDSPELELILMFQDAPLTELNDDWDVLSQTADQIKLIDVSGGNGGTDQLTFTRI